MRTSSACCHACCLLDYRLRRGLAHGPFSLEKATEPAVSSLRAAEASLDDRVEELSEEVEPLGLLDFAITVSIKAVEELLDLLVLGLLVTAVGKSSSSKSANFVSVDFTIIIGVELLESLLSLGESSGSGGSDLLLIGSGKVLCHGCISFIFEL